MVENSFYDGKSFKALKKINGFDNEFSYTKPLKIRFLLNSFKIFIHSLEFISINNLVHVFLKMTLEYFLLIKMLGEK